MLDETYLIKIRLKQPEQRQTAANKRGKSDRARKEATNTESFREVLSFLDGKSHFKLKGCARKSGAVNQETNPSLGGS